MADYAGGSGGSTLTFDYIVCGTGQNTPDLDYASIAALTLNGGSIVDTVDGNAASLTLPATGSDGLATQDIVIQTPLLPVVVGVSPDCGPTTGDTIIVITGIDFTGATAVYFGAAKATEFHGQLGHADHGHKPGRHGHGSGECDRDWPCRRLGDLVG